MQTAIDVIDVTPVASATFTEQYMSMLGNHPFFVIIATLVAASVMSKAVPHVVGAIVGTVTQTGWNVFKQTSVAAIRPFRPSFGTASKVPNHLRHQPKKGDRWAKALGTTEEKIATVLQISDEGYVYYNFADSTERKARYLGNFSYEMNRLGYKRV